MKNLIGAPRVN